MSARTQMITCLHDLDPEDLENAVTSELKKFYEFCKMMDWAGTKDEYGFVVNGMAICPVWGRVVMPTLLGSPDEAVMFEQIVWQVNIPTYTPATRECPEEEDYAEVATCRELLDALCEAARIELEERLASIAEAICPPVFE